MVAPRALVGHSRIGLDTAIFVYALEAHPQFARVADEVLFTVETGRVNAVASTLVLAELLVRPYRDGRPDIAQSYISALHGYPNLQLAAPDAATSVLAADLRGRHRALRLVDAVHVATALRAGATAFVTNDQDLPKDLPIRVVQLASLTGDT